MKLSYLRLSIILFFSWAQNYSLASTLSEPTSQVEIISRFAEPESPDNDVDINLFRHLHGGVIEAKDGSRYKFVLRSNKLAYFKKAYATAEWGDETPVNVADGVETNVYPVNFRTIFVYPYGDSLVKVVLGGWEGFDETRTLTIDLSTITIVKNEVTVESTRHLYKEYREQTAPPPTPGPQMPQGIEVYRISKERDGKGIYYYDKLIRQENGRIAHKEFFRLTDNGVWSPEYAVKNMAIPDDIAESYDMRGSHIKMVYGEDLTKDHFILVRLRRKDDAAKELSPYILLLFRETPTGDLSLDVLERELENFSPPIPEKDKDFGIGPLIEASYNEQTAELSVAANFQHMTRDQVFSVYNMDEKKRVKTRTVTHPEGFTAMWKSKLLSAQGESIGMLEYLRSSDVANFFFVKWSGSGEQKFYKISQGPDPKFSVTWSAMIWSNDQTKIYTVGRSGMICETRLLEGSLQCVTPDLGENIKGSNGSLKLLKDGVVELVASTSEYNREEDSRDTIIYSAVADFTGSKTEN